MSGKAKLDKWVKRVEAAKNRNSQDSSSSRDSTRSMEHIDAAQGTDTPATEAPPLPHKSEESQPKQSKLDSWLARTAAQKAKSPSVHAASKDRDSTSALEKQIEEMKREMEAMQQQAQREKAELLREIQEMKTSMPSTARSFSSDVNVHQQSQNQQTSSNAGTGAVEASPPPQALNPLAGVPPGGHAIDGTNGLSPELTGWARVMFRNGDYEGEFVAGKAQGFGRTVWNEMEMAYHGEMKDQMMHGKGKFFFPNGDMLTCDFDMHKPKGEGILLELRTGRRYRVLYDGTKKLSEGAEPIKRELLDEPEQIEQTTRVTITACSRGDKTQAFGQGNYSHCKKKAIDAKLAYAVPFRANKPIKNAQQLEGKIAVVQRGTCSYSKKLRYIQETGAVAMLVIGTDNLQKYQQVFQIHEGDPQQDDQWPEGQVPPPVQVKIPVCYALGMHEASLPHGAFVRLRFFEDAPGTPRGWLLGCIFVNKQTIHPDLTREEGDKLLADFLNQRKDERKQEAMELERRLKGEGSEERLRAEGLLEDLKDLQENLASAIKQGVQLDSNKCQEMLPALIDDWAAGQAGSMTFTVADPPVHFGPKLESASSVIRKKNFAGKRQNQEESTFELSLGDALLRLFQPKSEP